MIIVLEEEPESVKVLRECEELQLRKSRDYQNPDSNVRQADHYRRGIDTIHDMIWQKLLRAQSLLESGNSPSNETLEDTYKDIINYASFAVSYIRGAMDGQQADRDMFNDPVTEEVVDADVDE
jgi:Nucleotide modification associated domain 1